MTLYFLVFFLFFYVFQFDTAYKLAGAYHQIRADTVFCWTQNRRGIILDIGKVA